jgi:hypothetical protein
MQNSSSLLLALFVTYEIAFIWRTSNGLPALVVSHFGASGIANGFMLHDFYVLS